MIRGFKPLPFVALLSLSAAGCGSSATTSVTAPSNARCEPALGAVPSSFAAAGATGSLSVAVARECAWTAASTVSWIVLTSGREGQGDGAVGYRVDPNADPVSRRGSITVSDKVVAVAQEAAPCRFTVAAPQTSAPAAGGDLSVDVRTHTACNWAASAAASWISVSPSSGSGDGVVRLRIDANDGPLREADVSIAGQRVTIAQQATAAPPAPAPPAPTPPAPTPPTPTPPAPTPPPPTCVYELTPTSASFEATGGSGAFRVRTAAGCAWTAKSGASWLIISDPAAGTGEREVRYTVAENFTTSNRSTTVTVATETYRVSQDRASEIELEGKISELSGSCPNLRFMVQNRWVTTDGDTDFRGGRCSDARNGLQVRVIGLRQSDGSIKARRVDLDR